MKFTILIVKESGSDYGVIVPGLPGCFSAGKTVEDATENAKEAIALHIEGIKEDGGLIPVQPDEVFLSQVEIVTEREGENGKGI